MSTSVWSISQNLLMTASHGLMINSRVTTTRVARDPTSQMQFISAGLEIQTIGCNFLCVLNVDLDHYDFPIDFRYICLSSNDCNLLSAIIDSAMSRQTNTITLGVRTFHANLSHEW